MVSIPWTLAAHHAQGMAGVKGWVQGVVGWVACSAWANAPQHAQHHCGESSHLSKTASSNNDVLAVFSTSVQ